MSTLLKFCSIGLLSALVLIGAETAFTGTWEFNAAKSKVMSYPDALKTSTVIVRDVGNDTAEVSIRGTTADGTAFSRTYTVGMSGGPSTYSEGAPPAGISEMTKKINSNTREVTATRDGKTLRVNHAVVSADGKTLTMAIEGVTNDGRPLKATQVYDKQ